MPRKWHRNSEFGPGPRVPLDRERRAQWRARLDIFRRAGRLTADHVEVGRALLRRLGEDGRCDPSHATLAADAGESERTVRRALHAMASCGLLSWVRRLVRDRWRAAQTSNAYRLLVQAAQPFACGGQAGRGTVLRNLRLGGEEHGDEWARWNAARQIAALTGGEPIQPFRVAA